MSFVFELFKKISLYSDNIAVSLDEKKISYSELNLKALSVSQAIKNNKLNYQNIGLVGQRNFSAYYGLLGIIYSGSTYVPINNKFTDDKIIKIFIQTTIKTLVGDFKSLQKIKTAIIQSNVETIIIPDEVIVNNNFFGNKIQIIDKTMIDDLNSNEPLISSDNDLLYIMFTSGSTGEPKGVKVTNKNQIEFQKNTGLFYDLEVGFKSSQAYDLSFDTSTVDTFFTWLNGGELCILKELELLLPYDYIIRENLDTWNSVPTIGNFMLNMNLLQPNSFPSLRYSQFVGEQFSKKLADAWQAAAPNSTVENVYGPTEATVNISRFLYSKEFKKQKFKNNILPIGRPFNEHKVAIINENLSRVNEGCVGEIAFNGPQISEGYLNDQKKTDTVFVSLPSDNSKGLWYLTGDLGFINQNGLIECLGRKDNQIKLAGRRIELGEVETVLLSSNKLKDIFVIPIKNNLGTVLSLVAFTTSKLSDEEVKELIKEASRFLEVIFLPKKIIYIENLPQTISGKIDRKKLADIANNE